MAGRVISGSVYFQQIILFCFVWLRLYGLKAAVKMDPRISGKWRHQLCDIISLRVNSVHSEIPEISKIRKDFRPSGTITGAQKRRF